MYRIVALLVMAMSMIGLVSAKDDFVRVGADGRFYVADSTYRFTGTNFWYGPILASDGPWSDYDRLVAELDTLHALGLNNLRVLACADGPEGRPHHISPVGQTAPGVYDERLLVGLDRFIAELEKRKMKAVIYLTNAWEWSGGYGSYLEWSGHGTAPVPGIDGYDTYVNYAAEFVKSDSARAMYANHVSKIVGRVNTVTGCPYSSSPAIMAWQICNEPRPFSEDGKGAFADWILQTARQIKAIDLNHLVSTGSEGKYGCQVDIDLWRRIHTAPEIDYAIIHIWPTNWGWARRTHVEEDVDEAIRLSNDYITEHLKALEGTGRPLVIEEFGYPRNGNSPELTAPVTARNKYYAAIAHRAATEPGISGINFWGWGGLATPHSAKWLPGAPMVCDPAHEPQGWYSVFVTDSSTIEALKK